MLSLVKAAAPLARLLAVTVVAALSASASGCYSKATGYGAKFTFAYAAGADFENFVKPVAPGAKLDVVVFANGTEDKLVITAATSSKPSVLAVESVGERSLVLKGGEPGVADIEVTARDASGKVLVDRMYLHVEKPAVHGLAHACTDGPDAIYVQGDRVDVYHGLATSDGRPVIGYGYVHVRVEPAAGLELVAQPQGAAVYIYRAPTVNPRITIRSTVDDGALSLRVVKRGELKTATLDCGGDCTLIEGGQRYVVARVRMGETPVCSQSALTRARSLTPAICSVTAKLDDDDGSETNREQLAIVTGLKFGVCKYELTLPELDGGKGVRLTGEAKIGRLQFPGADGATEEKVDLLKRGATAWWLIGVGWLAPNIVLLACLGWKRRRARVGAGADGRLL
ncbi:hypothetical protein BH11MYX4_BH11MYX4_69060 [soil metagenome]